MKRSLKCRLLSMPWAATDRPSLGLGVLVSAARSKGFDVRAVYPNFDLAQAMAFELYEAFAQTPAIFGVAEHIFAVSIFGAQALDSDAYVAMEYPKLEAALSGSAQGNVLLELRDRYIPMFLDTWTERLLAEQPDIVGFSCTFNQVLPSLALAQRLKARKPELCIIFGGACVHGAMGEEYARAFPQWIDHVFTGEADQVFVEFLERISSERTVSDLPGVTERGALASPAVPFEQMNSLPTPNYADYFSERDRLLELGRPVPSRYTIPYESSRGCWWGAKNHCTFCGLNAEGMNYRMKSSDRIAEELVELATSYRTTRLMAADNILPAAGYRDLLPTLEKLGLDFELFYEIKANVSRNDVAALARAGVSAVQPGVESFSTNILKLMRKGVTALQNVQMLKWMQEYGLEVIYNVLIGFPGETPEDYLEQENIMRAIRHLPPPTGAAHAQVHRFSPFYMEPEKHGISGIRPCEFYQRLIPDGRADLEKLAYFFDHDLPNAERVLAEERRLNALIEDWKASDRRMSARLGPGFLELDVSENQHVRRLTLSRVQSLVLVLSDRRVSPDALVQRVNECARAEATRFREDLEELLTNGLLLFDGASFLSVVPFARPRTEAELDGWLQRWFSSAAKRPAKRPRLALAG
jgi:ribosomal peptide maturation radical SAM protein 1